MLDEIIEKIKFYISLGRDALVWRTVVDYMESTDPLEDRKKVLSYLIDNSQIIIFVCALYQLESSKIKDAREIAEAFRDNHDKDMGDFRKEIPIFIEIMDSTVKTIDDTYRIINETALLKKEKYKLQKESDDLQSFIDDLTEDEDENA